MPEVRNYNDVGTHHSGPAGFDIRTFECPACDDVHQCAVAFVEDEVAGNSRLAPGFDITPSPENFVDRHGSASLTQLLLPLRGVSELAFHSR
jgi:hypothetical protein